MAVYTVKPGDSLSKIAKILGIPDWRVLYEMNKSVIGPNPNYIRVGTQLNYGDTTSTQAQPTTPTTNPGTTAAGEIVPQTPWTQVMPWEQFFDPNLAKSAIAQRSARYYDPLIQEAQQGIESEYAARNLTRSGARGKSLLDTYREMADQEATMREQLYGTREKEARESYGQQQKLYEESPTGYKPTPYKTKGYEYQYPEESPQRYARSYRDWLKNVYKM